MFRVTYKLQRKEVPTFLSDRASDIELAISRFESSRPSQPVPRLETLPSLTSETPANGGLLRIGYRSPGSQISRCGSEIADSLRRVFEIFPFLGDSDRRPGSIGTAWPRWQCERLDSRRRPAAVWQGRAEIEILVQELNGY